MDYDAEIYSVMNNVFITVTNPNGDQFKYMFKHNNPQSGWWSNPTRYSTSNSDLQNLNAMIVDLPIGPWNLLNREKNPEGLFGVSFVMVSYNTDGKWVEVSWDQTAENIVSVGDTYTVSTNGNFDYNTYTEYEGSETYTQVPIGTELKVGTKYKFFNSGTTAYDFTNIYNARTGENVTAVKNIYSFFTVGVGSETQPTNWGDRDLQESNYLAKTYVPQTSQLYSFEVTCPGKYTPYQLSWENEVGGFDYFSFKMVSEKSETSEKTYFENRIDTLGGNQYLGNQSMGRKSYDKGVRTLGVTSNEVVTVNSDWLTDAELLFLGDLIKSKNIFMLDETVMSENDNFEGAPKLSLGRWYAVILDDDSITYKTNKRGLKQLSLTLIKNTTKK